MKKKRIIRMTLLGKVITTIIILAVGAFLYAYAGQWGEEQTKMAIILCVISWGFLIIMQWAFLHFIWER